MNGNLPMASRFKAIATSHKVTMYEPSCALRDNTITPVPTEPRAMPAVTERCPGQHVEHFVPICNL